MIPLRLRLENFMSYRELELDFRGLHLAVLTGANGAGKSSLLDALTYALWDRARAGGEQLIRLGASELWVDLAFAVEGVTYRVWRRRTRKAGGSQLELHQLAPGATLDSESWIPLTGTSMRETQARLNAVVRMDYETFVHSAFIRQGDAAAFTTKAPRERKAVLGEMLGLTRFDALSQAARDRFKAAQARVAVLDAEAADLRQRLEQRSALAEARERVRARVAELAETLADLDAAHEELVAEGEGLKRLESDRAALESQLAEAEATGARLEAELAEARSERRDAERALATADRVEADYAEWQRLQGVEQALRKAASTRLKLEAARAQARFGLDEADKGHEAARRLVESEAQALAAERSALASTVAEGDRVEEAYEKLLAARAAESRLMEAALAAAKLEERRHALALEAEAFRVEAASRKRALEARAAAAQAEALALVGVESALAEAESQRQAFARRQTECERVRDRGTRARADLDAALAAAASSRAAAARKRARLEELESAPAVAARGRPVAPSCPECESPVEGTQLARRLSAEIEALEAEAARHDDEAARLEETREAERRRFVELARALEGRDEALIQLGELRERARRLTHVRAEAAALAAEAETTRPTLPERLAASLDEVESALAALAYDPAELAVAQAARHDYRWAESRHWQLAQSRAALARLAERERAIAEDAAGREALWAREHERLDHEITRLDAALAETPYDADRHEAVEARLEALAGASAAWAELERHRARFNGATSAIARLESDRARAESRRAEASTALAEAASALLGASGWRERFARVEAERAECREQEREALAEAGRLEARTAEVEAAAARLEAADAEREAALADAAAYKELVAAFGKDGIQALMIENAIPEIEEEANRLLSRMTDNRMHVQLATQREKKTGGLNETLEIVIADEVGTRPYELYSGGEAFRVDFALRLALSRLLARRSGARLQTLVIDEGFGTQDDRGRERLVEAIHAVSEEFERIFVVTHIRELKEAFNTQIEVVKTGGVSTVHLIGT